ncbi:hypothetical protein MKW94_024732 [Papaver nudicaule]|uniref:Uncharacterized protein n=1 Tax=Papaver nudicaule TaxID=74823 RepID=A0AA41VX84_PAPNU|nr:hypothetical protein [Papaver nudicaule]
MGGDAGSKVLRLFSFLGAGVICTYSINLYRDIERKKLTQKQIAEEIAEKGNMVNKATVEN